MINEIISNILSTVGHDVGSVSQILSMLLMVTLLSFYELTIYRTISHHGIYNKSFNTVMLVIPYFIGAIIMALQSNIVITLGTIGALAIIRFRTALKDPIDMTFVLWSIFIGITCGCALYELCILTSLVVTFVLFIINSSVISKLFNAPYVLILNCDSNIEEKLTNEIKNFSKQFRLKSSNYNSNSYDYVYLINIKNRNGLINYLQCNKNITKYSLIEYDNDDII